MRRSPCGVVLLGSRIAGAAPRPEREPVRPTEREPPLPDVLESERPALREPFFEADFEPPRPSSARDAPSRTPRDDEDRREAPDRVDLRAPLAFPASSCTIDTPADSGRTASTSWDISESLGCDVLPVFLRTPSLLAVFARPESTAESPERLPRVRRLSVGVPAMSSANSTAPLLLALLPRRCVAVDVEFSCSITIIYFFFC